MNAITNPHKGGASPVGGASKARISAKTRKAIEYMVKKGCNQQEAAKLADMNAAALSRALSKPHTKAALQDAQMQFIQQAKERRELYKALAWEKAHEIAQNSKDERVSLKAVELLTGESKQNGPQLSVTVNAGGGYEFVPPNARVIEIEGSATDQASGNQGDETPAIAGPDGDV